MSIQQDSGNPSIETWDKVAENYNIEIDPSEKKLAEEIAGIFLSLGVKDNISILELGAGSGHLSAILSQQGFNVTLVDFSQKALEKAKDCFDNYGVTGTFIKDDIMLMNFIEPKYDIIWNSGVMEHFDDENLKKALIGIKRKVNKYFIFFVPNPKSYSYIINRYKHMKEGNWSFGTEYLREDYEDIIKLAGFEILHTRYIGEGFTKDQLNMVYGNEKVSAYFDELAQYKMIPDNERYLIGYILVPQNKSNLAQPEILFKPERITEYKTAVFDLVAQLNGLKDQLNSREEYLKEKQRLIDDLEINLHNQAIAISSLESLLKEKEVYLRKQEELNGKLHQEMNILRQEMNMLRQEKDTLSQEKRVLQQINDQAKAKILEFNSTKAFRILHFFKRTKYQLIKGLTTDKKEYMSWFLKKIMHRAILEDNRFNPLFHLLQILNYSYYSEFPEENTKNVNLNKNETNILSFEKCYSERQEYFRQILNQTLSEESLQIIDILNHRAFKGIVVYPSAVHWEPIQRPQQFLIELGERGYLCFFCDQSNEEFKIEEKYQNVFIINKEEMLLPVLRNKFIIVLCTWLIQKAWIDMVHNKFIWYDILDKIEFFHLYDVNMKKSHDLMVNEADFVSYSAKRLKKYAINRENVQYLPNACRIEDFKINNDSDIPQDMKKIVTKYGIVLGYFGAIEEWFDIDLICELASKHPDWAIALIGKIGIDSIEFDYDNIFLLGQKPYNTLYSYAQYFNVGVIPFIVNDLTNHVSPVKFFEYASLGIPVVSTNIEEMKQYESEWVRLASNVDEFETQIQECLTKDVNSIAKIQGLELAKNNHWKNRIDKFEWYIQRNSQAWKVFSNVKTNDAVAIMSATFLDFNGRNFYSGGAERYLLDISDICNKQGLTVQIYQYGNSTWMRRFRNIDVISLSTGEFTADQLSLKAIKSFNRAFYELTQQSTCLNIYSAFFEAWPIAATPSIGISHGVSWDNPSSDFKSGMQFWEQNKRFIESVNMCDQIISVDTNTANWFQTINYNLGKKIQVIPNYVDLDEFRPREVYLEPRDKVIILYPRRLYAARGLYIVLEVLDDILEKYPFTEFHFVGKGFKEDTNYVMTKQKKWGNRVQWASYAPEEMMKAYQQADISLIPTLYSEGTSLSCLEAMACGNAVIATRIGGLTDLVIDGYNGYLIEPSATALKYALESLLQDTCKMNLFKEKSVSVAAAFSKIRWVKQWQTILRDNMRAIKVMEANKKGSLLEFYLSKDYIQNETVGQFIISLLIGGHLIYIRTKDQLNSGSFGRIQWVQWEEENLSVPDIVFADEKIVSEVAKRIDIIINKEWLNKFKDDPLFYIRQLKR